MINLIILAALAALLMVFAIITPTSPEPEKVAERPIFRVRMAKWGVNHLLNPDTGKTLCGRSGVYAHSYPVHPDRRLCVQCKEVHHG